jgi:aspartyl-tRNA(Asn)/glutamyl-tRNA(Gln) amidotransferase subunit A
MGEIRDHLCDQPLVEVAQRIVRRELSPVEVTEAVLARTEALNPHLNVFITVLEEEARAQAAAADREIQGGSYRGPLHGIPVSVKDLFWTAGVPTTAGSRILADFTPETDATVVTRLNEAGAVVFGKANMLEFAYASVHPDVGPALNPWDATRTTSGSSSGSAAAVAAGMGYGSIGSDTGGSIRLPAAYCGVVGLKPTYGRVSRHGAIPVSWSCDHIGPLTRTVADCAALLGAIAGWDPRDSTTGNVPVPDYVTGLDPDVSALRIGISEPYLRGQVDPAVLALVEAALTHFEGLGATVRAVELPSPHDVVPVLLALIMPEAAEYHLPSLQRSPEDFSQPVRERLELGLLTPAFSYIRAQRLRRQIVRRFLDGMDEVDILLMPTSPVPATPLDDDLISSDEADPALLAALINFTGPFDVTGFPAISIPCGFTKTGLPVGLQLVAKPWEEQTLFSAAWAYEQTTPWHRHTPPVVGNALQ